ncbi:protein MAIN-LIKE 1-like [Vicia villosa]|uniref:protein MAIN-LIKE 1-like n=1 Tax=Vicia villosa TaxID=3911 RepID=UPI00273BD852|nr:protein MAIN-LIKE 1-like [Vicia villosa]
MDEAPVGSSYGSRSRLARASSSREVEEEVGVEEEEIPDVYPEHDEDGAGEEEGYPGGLAHTFVFIHYHDHVTRRVWEGEERETIKSMNHARKLFDLFKPRAQWFNDVVDGSGLGGLCMTEYSTISHGMQGAFVERWHKETFSFHFPVGDLTITLHDVACLLHLPTRVRLLDHSRIQRVEAIEWMVDYLGMDPNMLDYECRATSGAHIRFSRLKEHYENHLVAVAESEEEGDGLFVEYHYGCALRCWFMFLGWIISYFNLIHDFNINPVYDDAIPRAARYVLQIGNNKVGLYRVYLDHTVHDDIHWMPFTGHGNNVSFDRIILYSGWLACGTNTMVRYLSERCMRQFRRVQMIPRSLFKAAPDTVIRVGLTTIFEDWVHHLVPEEYRRMMVIQR